MASCERDEAALVQTKCDSLIAVSQYPNTYAALGSFKVVDLRGAVSAPGADVQPFSVTDYPPLPERAEDRRQEFVNGFGHLGFEYGKVVAEYVREAGVPDQASGVTAGASGSPDLIAQKVIDARFDKFQQRMGLVYQIDRHAFLDLGKLGDDMLKVPPPTPADIGKRVGDIIGNSTFATMQPKGQEAILGALAGVMIAARSTFGEHPNGATLADNNKALVDAVQGELSKFGVKNPQAIIWGDTHEPGFWRQDLELTPEQRHNFIEPKQ